MPSGVYIRTKPSHWLGKYQTEESKLKNRLAHLGKPVWNKGLTSSDNEVHRRV